MHQDAGQSCQAEDNAEYSAPEVLMWGPQNIQVLPARASHGPENREAHPSSCTLSPGWMWTRPQCGAAGKSMTGTMQHPKLMFVTCSQMRPLAAEPAKKCLDATFGCFVPRPMAVDLTAIKESVG
jgi:hypothetical protein